MSEDGEDKSMTTRDQPLHEALRDEALHETLRICDEIDDYSHELRMDWSDFDGRDAKRTLNKFTDRIRDALAGMLDPLRAGLRTRGTIVEEALQETLSGIVDADHPRSENGTGKWRCRCRDHVAALAALEGASQP